MYFLLLVGLVLYAADCRGVVLVVVFICVIVVLRIVFADNLRGLRGAVDGV